MNQHSMVASAILGVEANASHRAVRRAFRKATLRLHPDVAGPFARRAFELVVAAHDLLECPNLDTDQAFSNALASLGIVTIDDANTYRETHFAANIEPAAANPFASATRMTVTGQRVDLKL